MTKDSPCESVWLVFGRDSYGKFRNAMSRFDI